MSSKTGSQNENQTVTISGVDVENPSSDDVIADIWDSYYTVEESLKEDEFYVWTSAKSVEYGYPEQSHIQHIRNGVSFILRLYEVLSDDMALSPKTVRRSIAAFVAHDHHKRLQEHKGEEKQFEITLDEAEEFLEENDLHEISDTLTVDELRGIMAAHHRMDDRALSEAVPQSAIDEFHLVLLADSVSSTEKGENLRMKMMQDRLTSATLNNSHTVRRHTFTHENDIIQKVVNQAVVDTMKAREGWKLLRQYKDGCLYVSTHADEPETEDLLDEVYDKFHERLSDGHLSYTDRTIESGGIDLISNSDRRYDVSHRDVFYQGPIDVSVGIMQKAISDSRNTKSFPQDEERRINEHIEPYIETEINTKTRRITGLARGIWTLYYSIIQHLTDPTAEEDWKQDGLLATLRVLDIDTEENLEEIKKLREENGEKLVSGNGEQWDYKYVLGQYVYERYYNGSGTTSLKNTFRSLIEANLPRMPRFEEYEDMIGVEKMHTELKTQIYQGLTIGDGLIENPDEDFFEGQETDTCTICNGKTTATQDSGFHDDHYLLKETPELDVKNGQGVTQLENDTLLCYACQLEIGTRHSFSTGMGEDHEETLYAHFQTEYGYVPLSWRIESRTRQQALSSDVKHYEPDAFKDAIWGEGEQVEVFKNLNHSDFDGWENYERGFHPMEAYGGMPIPVADLEDPVDVYRAVTAIAISSANAGVSVHFTKYPLQTVDKGENEVVSFGEDVIDDIPLYDGHVSLNNLRDVVEENMAIDQFVEEVGFVGSPTSVWTQFTEHLDYPGSRALQMASTSLSSNPKYVDTCLRLDEKYGSPISSVEKMALANTEMETSRGDTVRGDIIEGVTVEDVVTDESSFEKAMAELYVESVEAIREGEVPYQGAIDGVLSRLQAE